MDKEEKFLGILDDQELDERKVGDFYTTLNGVFTITRIVFIKEVGYFKRIKQYAVYGTYTGPTV